MRQSNRFITRDLCTGLLVSLLLVCVPAYAETGIEMTGGWADTQTADDLQSGAGSDLWPTSESASDALSITITTPVSDWRVDVQRDNDLWHANLHLWYQRTGDGIGGEISGGGTYQEITILVSSFFSGTGASSNIPIQLKITGISIQVPSGVYTTTITVTVVDI